ncbi:TonB-dependent receptor [Altererythrobacter lutimaris]|uniref:TonB-dependent receptor n=1 Tax=Altererythrobacter lutimaris TaxID=2743979 RepID=UPI0015943B4E
MIIVTAQKREERLQDVPLTVSVVSSEDLEARSIVNATQLQNASPELNYADQPSAGYSIRGSGTQTFTRSAENNVLLVVDGIVQGQLTPPTNSLFDVEQIEILSGPQGMLFGKNASAGVVNIVTRRPELGEFSARGRASVGEDGFLVLDGTLNVAVGDTAALRVTGFLDEIGNRFTNALTGEGVGERQTYGARGRFLLEANEDLEFLINADYEKVKGGNRAWQARSLNPNGALNALLTNCGVVASPENTDVCLDGPLNFASESYGASLEVNYDLGGAVITAIGGYRYFERNSDTDSDATPINILNNNSVDEDVEQWSAEVRIASTGRSQLEYVAGLFFYDYRYNPIIAQSGTLGFLPVTATRSFDTQVDQRSYAVFGQLGYSLTDELKLIAGGRYTRDELDVERINFVDPDRGVRIPGFTNPDGVFQRSIDTNNFSWRLGVQYLPSPDVTFFATVSRGYKGPAINPIEPSSLAPDIVNEEIPTNYEIGVKGQTADGTLRGDLTFFVTDVEDFQAQTVADVNGLTQFVFTNADSIRFKGFQASAGIFPTDGLSFSFGLLYNEATYGDLVVQCNAPFLDGCEAGPGGQVINVNGRQLAGAPKIKFTASTRYERDLTPGVAAFIDLASVTRGDVNSSPAPDPNVEIDGDTLVDGRIGIKDPDGQWEVSVFTRNLFDVRAPSLIFRDPIQPTLNYHQALGESAFRTIGATVEFNF